NQPSIIFVLVSSGSRQYPRIRLVPWTKISPGFSGHGPTVLPLSSTTLIRVPITAYPTGQGSRLGGGFGGNQKNATRGEFSVQPYMFTMRAVGKKLEICITSCESSGWPPVITYLKELESPEDIPCRIIMRSEVGLAAIPVMRW